MGSTGRVTSRVTRGARLPQSLVLLRFLARMACKVCAAVCPAGDTLLRRPAQLGVSGLSNSVTDLAGVASPRHPSAVPPPSRDGNAGFSKHRPQATDHTQATG